MPDEEKHRAHRQPNDRDAEPGVDVCEMCESEEEDLSKRRVPVFLKRVCWRHLPTAERKAYKQLIERHKQQLTKKNLTGARLEGANLRGADLRGADLSWVHLEAADLSHAQLQRAIFFNAHLEKAKLIKAHLEGANLTAAHLEGADLWFARLEQANLRFSQVRDARLPGMGWMTRYTLPHMLKDGGRWWAAQFPIGILVRALWKTRSPGRSLKITKRVRYHLKRDLTLPITGWQAASGVETAATDSLTRRYISDIAYIQDLRLKHRRWAFLWRWSCFYGQSFGLWLFWCIVLAGVFGIAFANYPYPDWLPQDGLLEWFLCGIAPKVKVLHAPRTYWCTPYYYSIVTFTTLGFGDVVPVNAAGQIWVTAEVILGYIGLGGLISILANKVARRS